MRAEAAWVGAAWRRWCLAAAPPQRSGPHRPCRPRPVGALWVRTPPGSKLSQRGRPTHRACACAVVPSMDRELLGPPAPGDGREPDDPVVGARASAPAGMAIAADRAAGEGPTGGGGGGGCERGNASVLAVAAKARAAGDGPTVGAAPVSSEDRDQPEVNGPAGSSERAAASCERAAGEGPTAGGAGGGRSTGRMPADAISARADGDGPIGGGTAAGRGGSGVGAGAVVAPHRAAGDGPTTGGAGAATPSVLYTSSSPKLSRSPLTAASISPASPASPSAPPSIDRAVAASGQGKWAPAAWVEGNRVCAWCSSILNSCGGKAMHCEKIKPRLLTCILLTSARAATANTTSHHAAVRTMCRHMRVCLTYPGPGGAPSSTARHSCTRAAGRAAAPGGRPGRPRPPRLWPPPQASP
jgi:hypothetical protein